MMTLNKLEKSTDKQYMQAFALPTVVIATVVLMMVLVTSVGAVTSSRVALDTQYYQAISRDAAESGTNYARFCYQEVSKSASASQWPNAGTLDTGDNCFGEATPSKNCTTTTGNATCYVVKQPGVITRFSVDSSVQNGLTYSFRSNGIVSLLRKSNATVAKTTSQDVSFQGFSQIAGIATGNDTACAIQNGELYCWGVNTRGQAGTGAPVNQTTPFHVLGEMLGKHVFYVATGISHTCAIAGDSSDAKSATQIYCWGWNNVYQYGISRPDSLTPVRVNASNAIPNVYYTGISARDHTCVMAHAMVGTSVSEYCWGSNYYGQASENGASGAAVVTDPKLGPGPPVRTGDAASTTLTNVQSINNVSGELACNINSGQVYCWGSNGSAQGGVGTVGGPHVLRPVAVPGMTNATKIVTNNGKVCALMSARLYCWGANDPNTGTPDYRNDSGPAVATMANIVNPTRIITSASSKYNADITDVAITDYSGCVIIGGTVYCWGYNQVGQLGNGSISGPSNGTATSPSQVLSANNMTPVGGVLSGKVAVKIVGGNNHYCVITNSNEAYCWGWNVAGQLGDGTTTNRPTPVETTMPTGYLY
jgi:alpha-tubulin suppressor-like RCC1 family protein